MAPTIVYRLLVGETICFQPFPGLPLPLVKKLLSETKLDSIGRSSFAFVVIFPAFSPHTKGL